MLRVLHIYKTYKTESIGGAGEVIYQLGRLSPRHGILPKVFTLSRSPHPQRIHDEDIEVIRVPLDFSLASTDFSWKALLEFRAITNEADILHYHFPWPYGDLLHFFCRPRKKPMVVTYHSDIVKQQRLMWLYAPLMHWFLRRADMLVVTSPRYASGSATLQRYLDKTISIPIGLKDTYTPAPSPEDLQRMASRIGHPRFFCFLGVLRYYKGVHLLLEASAGVDFPIVIAGAGPKEKDLKAQAKLLGLKHVVFLSAITEQEKSALLHLTYAFVLPSHLRSEAFGISLLEAAMHGKPLICAEIGTGTSFINQDQETGLCVPPADPVALRKAMQTLWDNPEKASEMGVAARKRYESLFTADQMAASYATLYKKLVHQNP